VLDHLLQRRAPDAAALEALVDHEAPDAHLRLRRRRRRQQRFVLQHHEARQLVTAVDGAVPGLGREQRLRERHRVARDKTLLVLGHREADHGDHRVGGDLAQRDGCGIHAVILLVRQGFRPREPSS
jgi:hypothetical protein